MLPSWLLAANCCLCPVSLKPKMAAHQGWPAPADCLLQPLKLQAPRSALPQSNYQCMHRKIKTRTAFCLSLMFSLLSFTLAVKSTAVTSRKHTYSLAISNLIFKIFVSLYRLLFRISGERNSLPDIRVMM